MESISLLMTRSKLLDSWESMQKGAGIHQLADGEEHAPLFQANVLNVSMLRKWWVNPLSGQFVEGNPHLLDLVHLCDQHD